MRDLASDDGNGRKRLPESRQSRVPAIVTEDRAGPLNSIDEAYQALHGRHLRKRRSSGGWGSERDDENARSESERENEVEEGSGDEEESYFC